MAGEWLKWCKGLPRKREVVIIASMCKRDRHEIAGRSMALLEWLDDNFSITNIAPGSDDVSLKIGDRPLEFLDEILGLTGMAAAMTSESVGWLRLNADGSVTFPNLARHNGNSAKTRALEQRKKQNQRTNARSVSRNCPAVNGTTPGPEPGPEKRREDKISSSPSPLHKAGDDDDGELSKDSEQSIIAGRLRSLGIRAFKTTAERAMELRAFAVVMATIDHFEQQLRLLDGTIAYAEGPQFLAWRIADSACGESDPTAGWMEPNNPAFIAKKRDGAEQSRRQEERNAARTREAAAVVPSERESRFGPTLDAMTWSDAEALLQTSPQAETLMRLATRRIRDGEHPEKSPTIRDELLRLIETRSAAGDSGGKDAAAA